MASVTGICGGLVGLKSGNVKKVFVFKGLFEGAEFVLSSPGTAQVGTKTATSTPKLTPIWKKLGPKPPKVSPSRPQVSHK